MSSKSSRQKGGQRNQQVPVSIPTPQMVPQQPTQPTIITSGQAAILSEPDPTKRWHTIYPQYINSNLTIQCGRRLAKSECVPYPLAEEIFKVLAVNPQQFEVAIDQRKCYCREIDKENIRNRGYVKYRLLDNKQFPNKKQVLIYVASMILKLKTRQNPKPVTSGQDGGGGGGHPSTNPSGSSSAGGNKSSGNVGPQQSGGSGGGGGKKKNRRK